MRIHIKTTPSKKTIPYNHLHLLAGTIHKWLGKNKIHDSASLYSYSNLTGGKASDDGLDFTYGACFFISFWNIEWVKVMIEEIQKQPEMFDGLKVKELFLQEIPDLSEKSYFEIGSPIFIQRTNTEGNKKFFYYNDEESSKLLVDTLITKQKAAGLPIDTTLKIRFDLDFTGKRTRKFDYKKDNNIIQIRANWCPVIIEGKLKTKQFAWNVGLGNSTGIGFGAIK